MFSRFENGLDLMWKCRTRHRLDGVRELARVPVSRSVSAALCRRRFQVKSSRSLAARLKTKTLFCSKIMNTDNVQRQIHRFRSIWATVRVAIKCRQYKASPSYGLSKFAITLHSEILLKIIMYFLRNWPSQGPRSYVSYNPVLITV